MTTAILPRLSVPFAIPSFVASFVTEMLEGISEGRAMAARHDRLSRLTPSELARFRLARQDLPRAALTGVAGL